ncbi:asparagine synthetase B family protein [Aestuariirhabdus sp. LZHN29]|uniref:asparagine synthetase B family protein n=1 Tax=Aestuariirhabdus sp. LZHN29 TaxID=3417462 RepID=UPI003CFA0DA5
MQQSHLLVCVGRAETLPACVWTHFSVLPEGNAVGVVAPGISAAGNPMPSSGFIYSRGAAGFCWTTERPLTSPYLEIQIEDNGEVSLLADRFGQLPLYYCRESNYWSLSTRLSWVTKLSANKASLDPDALYQYLFFHCIPAPATIYRGVFRIDAAQTLSLNPITGALTTRTNWLPDFTKSSDTPTQLSEALFDTLKSAVTCRYDNACGTFLSGGLDSSTITGMMCRYTAGKDAYSIGFPIERYDESEYAQCAASHFGANLTSYSVSSGDVVKTLPFIMEAFEQPFGNSSVVPTYFCASLARENGKQLLLAGDGGDELFGGNERYRKQLLFEHFNRLPAYLRGGTEQLLSALPFQGARLISKARSYVSQASIPLPDRLHSYNLLKRIDLRSLLSEDFLQAHNSTQVAAQQHERFQEVNSNALNRMLYLDWKYTLCDNDLVKVNTMCSLAGIDVAYPMLDYALVDLSASLPSDLKIHRHELRHLFKRSMSEFLPGKILNKSKHGFGLPYGYWLQQDKSLERLTFDSIDSLTELGVFAPNLANNVLSLNSGEHAHYFGELAWVLMALGIWVDRVHNSRPAEQGPPMMVDTLPTDTVISRATP